jgi:carboxylate-amine ligase
MTDRGDGLTLGVEEEIHLVDVKTWQLAACAPKLLSQEAEASFDTEMQRSTVETRTDPRDSLEGLHTEIVRLRRRLAETAEPAGLGLAACGTLPSSSTEDFDLTRTRRYRRLQEQYRLLADEQLICGLQVHVEIGDRDLAVLAAQRVSWLLPTLLALSASSPFWNGQDTGYASIRSIIWQRWPSAGPTGPLGSATEYDTLIENLIRTGVLADAGMAYFDVRPSAHLPTLELRVCDACPEVDDAVMIAGLFRAGVRRALEDIRHGVPHEPIAVPLQRAATWLAARTGLSGSLLDDQARPEPIEAQRVVRNALERLRPRLVELGDYEVVGALVESALRRGNSADRQRAVFAEGARIEDVVSSVVDETMGLRAGPSSAWERC